jgi:hypothetical protein
MQDKMQGFFMFVHVEQDDAPPNINDSNLSGSALSAGGMNQNQKKIHKYKRQ